MHIALFDGIATAQLAHELLQTPIATYFSSETDPGCNRLIKQRFPDILVVFMSGYPGESGALLPEAFTENKLIMKPFAPQQLLETIQGLL